MGEQLRASVYKYLVAAGEKKAAKALRKAHADEDLENIDSPVLEDLFNAHAAQNGKQHSKAAPKADADHDDEEMPKKDKKKRKKEPEAEAPKVEKVEEKPEVVEDAPAVEQADASKHKEEKKVKKTNTPERFQRVKVEEVEFHDPRLMDYSHESKGDDAWGAKANAILSAVRGKDFRHEKTKKKRGSYSGAGGYITQQVNSIKFDD